MKIIASQGKNPKQLHNQSTGQAPLGYVNTGSKYTFNNSQMKKNTPTF